MAIDDDRAEADQDPEDGYPGECDHEHATVDVIEGRLSCSCGHHRWLDGAEIEAEAAFQARAFEAMHDEMLRDEGEAAIAGGTPAEGSPGAPAHRNALPYWFPRIEAAGLPVPRTTIARMPLAAQEDVWALFDGNDGDGGMTRS